MMEYEWRNPSSILLSGEDATQEPDTNRQISYHYVAATTQPPFNETLFSHQNNIAYSHQNHLHNPNHAQIQPHVNFHSLYDPYSYSGASAYSTDHTSLLSFDPVGGDGGGYFLVPKTGEVPGPVDFTRRIGLNLGGRTYFSSAEDDFVNRLYRIRGTRPGNLISANSPRCQAEGCNADLTHSKHYHRRHKVCEFHSKASTVIAAGLTQRFCQQCSRFHLLSEFDNGKRSCRKRLADHNRRRRKSQQQPNSNQVNGLNPSPDNPPRSPPDSGIQSSSSVTMSVSPPRMPLDYFKQSPYIGMVSSSSSATFFFSSG